ncbi:MAG: NAD(P)-dependent oxidoreductase [Clostridiales bacterium]|nr:NAD(P)-dependent oxidoreductase [Clostridiales bacterium]
MNLTDLEGKKVLITGASGLIGKALVSALALHNGEKPVKIFALVRNEAKARAVFSHLPCEVHYIVTDICELEPKDMGIDYIIHGASMTASKDFVASPVEVIESSYLGTKRILEFAKVNPVKSLVYLSTMEVYGAPDTDEKIAEEHSTNLDTMHVRSSYPESKRLCENLCTAYAKEYNVPAKVVRLTQTFGKGVDYNDGRVFAEFARCVIENRDIVLKTEGKTERNYLDVDDAVNAIYTVLTRGSTGEAYNAANEDSYCTIYQMACMVAEKFGKGKIRVKIERQNSEALGYAPTLKMNLSSKKLQALGWKAQTSLEKTYEKMIEDMRKTKQ